MQWQAQTRTYEMKEQIFCDWRKKWVKLTPEEWVRQQFLHSLVEQHHYPAGSIAVETAITVGQTSKRCDAVVYNITLKPVLIIEFKAEKVKLTQSVFDQVAVYNRKLNVQHFIISNGAQTYVCAVDNNTYNFLNNIPPYTTLT